MSKKVYFNGKIVCVDKDNNIEEAVLVENGIIIATGSNEDMIRKAYDRNDEVDEINLKGRTMLPGFIDPHGHIVAIAQSSMMPNFEEITSRDEMVLKLKAYLNENPKKDGEWLLGLGYDNSKFADGKHPTKVDLDKVSVEIPIFITHASGHIAAVNSKALELFGYIGNDYIVPKGGVVQTMGSSREANGVLEETAFLDETKKVLIGAPSFESVLAALDKAQDLYASYGITTAQDASVDKGVNQLLGAASQYGKLKLDIVGYAIQPVTAELMGKTSTLDAKYNNHYKLLGGKMWLDGSPQAKTAWLTKPYYIVPEDQKEDYCGYGTQADEEVTAYLTTCIEDNIQVNAHCNGDAASDQFIRCYKNALNATENQANLRPVMVHCQTLREDQLDCMQRIGMIPTFFLDHIFYWGDYHYESVLGPERAERISPAGSALKRGMNFTLHQDPPVKMPIMTLAIHNAVNRETESGRVLGEDQRIPVMEAIKAVTINGAYQYFEEKIKGSIEVGKLADFVVLDKCPIITEPKELKTIKVLETIKEGNTIYKAN
ncbi:MAG: amidohydrolase [Sarcina sp.]